MKAQESTWDLKVLAIIGALGFFAIVLVVPFTFGYFLLRHQLTVTPPDLSPPGIISTSTTIGEEGDPCGGKEHLPCGPGLMCTDGACRKAPASSAPLLGRTGDACANAPCAVGLYCKSSVCAEINDAAPHATSVKIEGATLEDGVYRLPLNATATVKIQTVNAASVVAALVPNEGFGTAGVSLWLGQTKKQGGGVYVSTLKLQHDFEGKIGITVTSAAHDASYVTVDVASAK